METETTMDLILIEENMPLADIWTPENVDAMIAKLEEYKNDFKGDVTTAKGRKEIISFSRKFSTSKVLVDNTGKELIEDWQVKTKAVNIQRRKFKDACDKFRDESRQPVTDFENAEKMLIANQNRTLARLVDLYNVAGDLSIESYEAYIEEVNAIEIDGDILSDFYTRGNREKEQTLNSLNQKLAAKIQYNKDQEDLAKLRADREKREKEEAAKKEKAEQKKLEKELKAKAKKEAEEKAAKKIADAKKAEEKAKADKKEAAEKAEREKKEAAEKAEKEKEEAVAAEKEKAAKAEKERLAKIEEERRADEKRAADKEHRDKIGQEIFDAIIGSDLDIGEQQAINLINEIDQGNIPHLSIKY